MKDIDPQAAIEEMWKLAPQYASAKATRIYLEEFSKSLRAGIMKACGETTVAAQEREAYAHQEYLKHLDGIRAAVEEEEKLRWRLVSAQTAVDIWRTQQASNRMIDRSAA